MAQAVNVNFRMDAELKKNMEQVCEDMGLSMTTAFTIFAKKVSREHRIPFEITADPFYSESNMAHLRRGIAALDSGKGVEHALLKDTERSPFEGIGKPEPLKGELSGFWSRRIDETNRFVYRVENGVLEILSCRGHYDD